MIEIDFTEDPQDEEKAKEMLENTDHTKEEILGLEYETDGVYTPSVLEDKEKDILYNVIEGEKSAEFPTVEKIEEKTRQKIKERKELGKTPYVARLNLTPQAQSRGAPYTWSYFGYMKITNHDLHYSILWAYYHPKVSGKAKVNYETGTLRISINEKL